LTFVAYTAEMQAVQMADPVVAHDLMCVRCGYNLKTLQHRAVCPECALPVEDSINGTDPDTPRYGPPLALERPEWHRGVALGFLYYPAGALIIWLIQRISINLGGSPPLSIGGQLCGWAVIAVGAWKVTSPRALMEFAPSRWRRIVRGVLLGDAIVCGAIVVLAFTMHFRPSLLEQIFHCSSAVATVFGFLWMRSLALQARNWELAVACYFPITVALIMCYSVVSAYRIFPVQYFQVISLVQPDVPLLGPVLHLRPEYTNGYSWFMFVCLAINVLTVLTFCVMSLRLSRASARRIRKPLH
jgi:hypothetical protein